MSNQEDSRNRLPETPAFWRLLAEGKNQPELSSGAVGANEGLSRNLNEDTVSPGIERKE